MCAPTCALGPLLSHLAVSLLSRCTATAGEWYCSDECQRIRTLVNTSVQAQVMEIPGYPNHTWQVRVCVGWWVWALAAGVWGNLVSRL